MDLLELMLEATEAAETEAGGRAGAGLSNQELLDECSTFLLAGHETTSNTVAWALMLLAQHPQWQERAREEARGVLREQGAKEGRHFPFEKLSELKLLGAILSETLRLFPAAAALVRTAARTVKLSEALTVPKGCDVAPMISWMQRRKDVWGEDANEFRPTRFLEASSPGGGTFIPFALGPRVCIGQNFAIIEAKTILAMLLLNFRWELAPNFCLLAEQLLTQKNKGGMPLSMELIH